MSICFPTRAPWCRVKSSKSCKDEGIKEKDSTDLPLILAFFLLLFGTNFNRHRTPSAPSRCLSPPTKPAL